MPNAKNELFQRELRHVVKGVFACHYQDICMYQTECHSKNQWWYEDHVLVGCAKQLFKKRVL